MLFCVGIKEPPLVMDAKVSVSLEHHHQTVKKIADGQTLTRCTDVKSLNLGISHVPLKAAAHEVLLMCC